MSSLEWSLRLVPSRGPDCHLSTFTSSSGAGGPGGLAGHTSAPAEVLGGKVWRRWVLG